jgi:hypothetical protein
MSRTPLALLLLLLMGACAATPPPLPPGARPDLGAEWVTPSGYRWPPADGFAAAPSHIVLPPGLTLDRFGGEGGRFFSPRGAAFRARALPTVCAELPYHVYRVTQPLLVRVGTAVPWFGEPGQATQVMTDATVAQLLAQGALERLPPEPPPCPR